MADLSPATTTYNLTLSENEALALMALTGSVYFKDGYEGTTPEARTLIGRVWESLAEGLQPLSNTENAKYAWYKGDLISTCQLTY